MKKSEAEDFANRISTNIALLEKCNNDWSNLLKELKDDEKVTEEREYARVCEGEDRLIEALLTGNEVLARLKARMIILQKRKDCVTGHANSNTRKFIAVNSIFSTSRKCEC